MAVSSRLNGQRLMEVRILGAHATEISGAKPTALVIDGTLAIDAGSLCSGLTLDGQLAVKALLITHYHYDYVKDLPTIGMDFAYHGYLDVYGTAAMLDALSTHLLDGKLYPDFRKWPEAQPALNLVKLEKYQPISVEGYDITALPVPHGVPAVGFQVISPKGKSLFFTGDTAGGLSSCWSHLSADLLITELTWPQEMEGSARRTTHLSPNCSRPILRSYGGRKAIRPALRSFASTRPGKPKSPRKWLSSPANWGPASCWAGRG